MKSILVTGGAGFIGSHTCFSLLEKGYNVYVLDSFINSSRKSLQNVLKILDEQGIDAKSKLNVVEGDIRDKNILKQIFFSSSMDNKPIDGVLHFAGLKSVSESVKNPILYWNSNFVNSLNLIETMLEFNCLTFVFSSSATIYGTSNKNPINEKAIIKPINPYGHTKACIETLLRNIYESDRKGLKIANLRYFNPVGAHPSGNIGEDPRGIPNNIFPIIAKVAVGKIKKLKVFGNDWPTSDGTGIRDYIHVMDLANGHINTLEFLLKNKPQFVNFNLGTGIGTSVLELINIFQKVNNIEIPYEFDQRREGDVAELVADNTVAKELINWKTERNIEDMCRDSFNWQKKNPYGYKFD